MKYQYKVIFVKVVEQLQADLNTARNQGWEAIHFQPNPNGSWHVIMVFHPPTA